MTSTFSHTFAFVWALLVPTGTQLIFTYILCDIRLPVITSSHNSNIGLLVASHVNIRDIRLPAFICVTSGYQWFRSYP